MATETPTLVRLETLALIGIGGFAGSNLRFFAIGIFPDALAILLVNVLGSGALGFFVYEAKFSGVVNRKARLVFTTGFLSSLTTYSGFAIGVATADSPLLVLGIIAGNYVLGFAGVLVGRAVALRLRGERA